MDPTEKRTSSPSTWCGWKVYKMAAPPTWLLLPRPNLGLGSSTDLLGSVLPLLLLLPAHLSLGFDDALNNTEYLLTDIKQNSKS